jgi:ribonuclease P protein component
MKKIIPITENYEFKRLYNKGDSCVTPFFVLYYKRNRRKFNRLGITASKKIGNAVKRNRARRRLKELYRLYAHEKVAGFDIVIVARAAAIDGDYNVMIQRFSKVLKQKFNV